MFCILTPSVRKSNFFFCSDQKLAEKSRGTADLLGLAFSLVSSLAHLQRFCFHLYHFLPLNQKASQNTL